MFTTKNVYIIIRVRLHARICTCTRTHIQTNVSGLGWARSPMALRLLSSWAGPIPHGITTVVNHLWHLAFCPSTGDPFALVFLKWKMCAGCASASNSPRCVPAWLSCVDAEIGDDPAQEHLEHNRDSVPDHQRELAVRHPACARPLQV